MKLLFGLYLVALAWLLWTAQKNRARYALAKGVCSVLFIVCGVLAGMTGPVLVWPKYYFLLAGLVLCAFGDILLGVANSKAQKVSKKPFLAGAISFSAAHVVFNFMAFWGRAFQLYDLALPIILCGTLVFLEKTDRVRLKKVRPLAYVYTGLIGLMAGKTVLNFCLPGPAQPSVWMLAGALLFLVSDIVLLFLYFGTQRRRYHRTLNLVTYYLGVFAMAYSAGQ